MMIAIQTEQFLYLSRIIVFPLIGAGVAIIVVLALFQLALGPGANWRGRLLESPVFIR